MLKWTVVGNRDGKAAVNWPGVAKAACMLGLITFLFSALFSKLLGMNIAEPISIILDVQFVAVILGVGIRRALSVPPESLPRLGSHVA